MPIQIDNEKIARFKQLVGESEKILILSHMNPDGDAVGSLLGMAHLLEKNISIPEKNLFLLLPHPCPTSFLYLEGSERIVAASVDMEACAKAFEEADLIIGVDFNSPGRTGILGQLLEEAKQPKILIDHHHNPAIESFNLIISYPDISSACELVHWVAYDAWGEDSFDFNSAQALFNGIVTDTGSFAFSNEHPSLYEAAQRLVRFPIGPARIHNEAFNSLSVDKMRFFAFALDRRMKIFPEEGFCYIYVSKEEFDQFGLDTNGTSGLVPYTLMMRPIHVGALIHEEDDRVRISFRSKNDFDVNDFARRHFEGGGHTKAAGATSHLSFEETVSFVEKTMLDELRQHNSNKQ